MVQIGRPFIHTTLREMWEEAEQKGDFGLDKDWQLRLASTWAIHQARDVVATVYHAAGATAIFNDNPFERRLRDIHAGTQQGQGRPIHFETVGQILLACRPKAACSGNRKVWLLFAVLSRKFTAGGIAFAAETLGFRRSGG